MVMVAEDIDPESWLTREVFANFGLAVYASQVLEHGIVNLVVLSGLRDGRYRSVDETDAENARLFRQTLGAVKNILLTRRPDIEHLDELLIRAVRLRNFLAHHYFRERAAAFVSGAGQARMIEELGQATAFFEDVDERIKSLAMQIMEVTGLQAHLPEAMEEARQAGFGEPLPGLGEAG